MPLTRSETVAARFGACARSYEQHAKLQGDVARTLADLLPAVGCSSILEVGCGTGLLTGHLLARYPEAGILATDLAPEMVVACRDNHAASAGHRLRLAVMDGENPSSGEKFDLVVLSMTLQWFSDPLKGLLLLDERLHPGGNLYYATLAPDCFPEWRRALRVQGVSTGLVEMPTLPGVRYEETHVIDYGSGSAFLNALKAIGAVTPRPGYRPLPPGGLRKALKSLDDDCAGQITWRIVYGCLSANDTIVP